MGGWAERVSHIERIFEEKWLVLTLSVVLIGRITWGLHQDQNCAKYHVERAF